MELIFEVLVTLAAATSLGLAVWSGRGHFQSDKMPLGSMIIAVTILVTTALDLYLVWSREQPLAALIVGLVLQAGGISLFALTIRASREARLRMAFDEGNPRGLVREGPYRYVRHPFYVSYIIYFSGFAIATWSIVAIFPIAIILVIYITAARMEEAKFANTAMAAEYEEYRRTTGFFFPKIAGA